MSDIDTVAEAIHKADHKVWPCFDALCMDQSRRLAQAAIDALQLTQEQRTLADGMGGMTTNSKTGKTTVHSLPCTRQSRLVTPWTAVTS